MSVGVRNVSSDPTGAGSPLAALYQQVLAQTGDTAAAQEAVGTAQAVLRDIYNRGVIASKGDTDYGNQVAAQYTPQVMQLAALVPTIKSNDPAASGRALTEAMGLLQRNGLSNPKALYPWLKEYVKSDDALRAAGFDPAEVRKPPDTVWANADLDALTALARDALVKYRNANGVALTPAEIDSQIEQYRAAAVRMGIGQARTTTAGAATAVPQGSVSVAAFNFPRRV